MHRNGSMGLALASMVCLQTAFAAGLTVTEDFSSDPAARGWKTHGEAGLFRWDGTARNLSVNWDSSKTNSYYHLPLGVTLRRTNEFALSFTIRLDDVQVGTTAGKPFTFELALGLLNFAGATDPGFLRGTGFNSPNLVEWDYFPDSGFGATISSTLISEQHKWASEFNSPYPLEAGVVYTFRLHYTPEDRTLRTTMEGGETPVLLKPVKLPAEFDDFSVDTLAVSSYSDAGQDPQFAGSVRATGMVDDLRLVAPPPPITEFRASFQNGVWQARFVGRADFDYTLEASEDLLAWNAAAPVVAGTDADQVIEDARPAAAHRLYRLKAVRR